MIQAWGQVGTPQSRWSLHRLVAVWAILLCLLAQLIPGGNLQAASLLLRGLQSEAECELPGEEESETESDVEATLAAHVQCIRREATAIIETTIVDATINRGAINSVQRAALAYYGHRISHEQLGCWRC